MENTTKAGTFNLVKTRILRAAILIALTFLISHVPLIGQCFPAAIALIAYMVSKNTINIYLIIPAAAGILPYITRGYDSWGELAALCVCGLLFVACRRIDLELWQRALMASSVGVICISIYRLATVTVYKTDLPSLLFEGFVIFCMVFIFDALYVSLQREGILHDSGISHGTGLSQGTASSHGTGLSSASVARINSQMPLTALAAVSLLAVCGAGLGFLIWPVIVFISLCGLAYLEIGQVLLMIITMSALAALADYSEWGIAVTLLIAACLASFAKKFGVFVCMVIFVLACWLLGSVEKGLVLGFDDYSLFLAAVVFLAVNWKFAAKIKKIIGIFAGDGKIAKDEKDSRADRLLRMRADEMEDLAELYSTYLDNRSILANQFNITEQIIDGVRWQINEASRNPLRFAHEKLTVDIAVSQCAATGAINGDCCGWQDIGNGRIAMVVSDGMGKGKKAATESLMVIKSIMSLLKSGVTADLTLKMINTIMLMKDDEDSFATVDLIIINKKTAKAKFYKIGAAPTLIRRKSNVEEVQLSAVPLGIVNGLKVRYVETTLKKNDWIIMMSDGVSDGGDGRGFLPYIKETVAKIRSTDPQTMCDLIMNQAADSYIGKERDDLTVMVAKVQ